MVGLLQSEEDIFDLSILCGRNTVLAFINYYLYSLIIQSLTNKLLRIQYKSRNLKIFNNFRIANLACFRTLVF